jgi:amyloid beta precursor protein binding protein 1
LNSGPGVVGVETLKNLVLPGIGNFTIQDSAVVSEADLGVNFFLEEEHLGGFRAEHTCNLLKELNPDVQGNFITEVRLICCRTNKLNSQHIANRIMAHKT